MPFSSVLGASSVIKPGVCTSSTRPTVPYEGQLIYETDTDLVLAYNGSSWRAVSNAIATNGGILQIVSTTKTDTFTSTSGTYVDITGLSLSITPNSTSNKVLVLANVVTAVDLDRGCFVRLVRDSTAIGVGDTAGNRVRSTTACVTVATATGGANLTFNQNINFLDSPSTTSSTTYKIQGMVNLSSPSTFYVNRMGSDTDATTRFRSVSTITAFEVSA